MIFVKIYLVLHDKIKQFPKTIYPGVKMRVFYDANKLRMQLIFLNKFSFCSYVNFFSNK